jgi:hypothetical protein
MAPAGPGTSSAVARWTVPAATRAAVTATATVAVEPTATTAAAATAATTARAARRDLALELGSHQVDLAAIIDGVHLDADAVARSSAISLM